VAGRRPPPAAQQGRSHARSNENTVLHVLQLRAHEESLNFLGKTNACNLHPFRARTIGRLAAASTGEYTVAGGDDELASDMDTAAAGAPSSAARPVCSPSRSSACAPRPLRQPGAGPHQQRRASGGRCCKLYECTSAAPRQLKRNW